MNTLPKYRPDIDGLRAIAVISVVLYHAFPSLMPGGFIGVDIFFVISGFLISTIIFENLDKGSFIFSHFYVRRIRRIFPALLVILIATYFFGWFVLPSDEYKQLGMHLISGAGFFSNFTLWNESGYFDNAAVTKPLLHLWSLGIEEQFYIVWPLILWIAWKHKKNLLIVTFIITLISFGLNIYDTGHNSIAAFYSPLARFWELLSGSILAWYLFYKKENYQHLVLTLDTFGNKILQAHKIQRHTPLFSQLVSFFGFFLLVLGFFCIHEESNFPGVWVLAPVLGTVLVILAGSKTRLNNTILSNKILVGIGLISYPLYLWHWPILSYAHIILGETPDVAFRVLLIIISGILAWLTYRFIERPIRFGMYSTIKVTFLIVMMIVVGLIGYYTYAQKGLLFRTITKTLIQERLNRIKEETISIRKKLPFGKCHLPKGNGNKDGKDYVTNWNCPSDDQGLLSSRILVFGDSHAADKAKALGFNGVDVVQITGSNCSVNPTRTSGKFEYCSDIFNVLENNGEKFDTIFLADSMSKAELTIEKLSEILTYWSGSKPVYFFTPMPRFESQMNDYVMFGKVSSKPDFSLEDIFLKNISELQVPTNITIIRTSDLWCSHHDASSSNPCSFYMNGKLLMIDGGHLSFDGAKIMGKNMLTHPILSQAFNHIKLLGHIKH